MATASHQPSTAGKFFAGCATIACLVQWAWSLLLLAYPFVNSDASKLFLPPKPAAAQPPVHIALPSSIEIILIIAAIALSLGLCILVIVWVPRELNRATVKTSRKTAEALVPIVSHHKPLSPKKKRILTTRILWWIKVVMILLPFVLLFLTPLFQTPLDARIALIFGAILFGITLFWSSLALAVNYWLPRR